MTINARIAEVDAAAVNRRLAREAFRFPTGIEAVNVMETEYNGVPAKKVDGGKHVAISLNCRRNGAQWAVVRDGDALHVDNVLCYLTRKEVSSWLVREVRA